MASSWHWSHLGGDSRSATISKYNPYLDNNVRMFLVIPRAIAKTIIYLQTED